MRTQAQRRTRSCSAQQQEPARTTAQPVQRSRSAARWWVAQTRTGRHTHWKPLGVPGCTHPAGRTPRVAGRRRQVADRRRQAVGRTRQEERRSAWAAPRSLTAARDSRRRVVGGATAAAGGIRLPLARRMPVAACRMPVAASRRAVAASHTPAAAHRTVAARDHLRQEPEPEREPERARARGQVRRCVVEAQVRRRRASSPPLPSLAAACARTPRPWRCPRGPNVRRLHQRHCRQLHRRGSVACMV